MKKFFRKIKIGIVKFFLGIPDLVWIILSICVLLSAIFLGIFTPLAPLKMPKDKFRVENIKKIEKKFYFLQKKEFREFYQALPSQIPLPLPEDIGRSNPFLPPR